jgi:hypothetical protein
MISNTSSKIIFARFLERMASLGRLKRMEIKYNKNGKINDVVIIPQVVKGRKGK